MIRQRIFQAFFAFIVFSAPLITWAGETTITLWNPISTDGKAISPYALYGRLISGLMAVMGAVALFFFLQGGFMWLTSAGSPEKVKKGQDILLWATLGLVVIFGSYIFLSYVISVVTGAIK